MDEIATQAQELLRSNSYLYSCRLTVQVEDGFIVVRGKVPVYYYKQMSQEIILPIIGNARMKNLIEVVKT